MVVLKPQDVVIVSKLVSSAERRSYADMGRDLFMSASEVHSGVKRLDYAGLVRGRSLEVNRAALQDFVGYGVPYAFPARPGEVTRGIPTAWAGPALRDQFRSGNELPPVWPDPEGKEQGVSVEPLYRSVPQAVRRNEALYTILSLIDALRIGRARERARARDVLEHLLKHDAAHV
jgi:DNA-binding Lrp family transcriptional regulator